METVNLQAVIDEALKSASDEANRRLVDQDKKLPPINTEVEASNQTNYRQPAHLEQRITEMRFDLPQLVAPKPEGMVSEVLMLSAEQAGTMGIYGSFCNVFRFDDKWWLTGGTVTAGDANEEIDDIHLGNVGSEPDDGTWFWIEASGTATTEDGLLLPGFDLTSATVGSGDSFPTGNTIPTVSSPSGSLQISLGSWSNGVFVPAGCGNIQIFHCPGTLRYSQG
jgi:hypothetical protein